MKVLNLQCSHQHVFEGWFGSDDEFQAQLAGGLLECPLCGDTGITKLPSAPRLNLGAQPAPAPKQDVAPMPDVGMQRAWLQMVRHVMANTEDVGERFAGEARRIHHGESENAASAARPRPKRPRRCWKRASAC